MDRLDSYRQIICTVLKPYIEAVISLSFVAGLW